MCLWVKAITLCPYRCKLGGKKNRLFLQLEYHKELSGERVCRANQALYVPVHVYQGK